MTQKERQGWGGGRCSFLFGGFGGGVAAESVKGQPC